MSENDAFSRQSKSASTQRMVNMIYYFL